MRRNLPSVKTLYELTSRYCRIESMKGARLLRKVLECTSQEAIQHVIDSNRDEFSEYSLPFGYHRHSLQRLKLDVADFLTHGYGVEYQNPGHGKRSPGFSYVNMGDSYAATLLWVNGRYKVACLGDIVERGNYD